MLNKYEKKRSRLLPADEDVARGHETILFNHKKKVPTALKITNPIIKFNLNCVLYFDLMWSDMNYSGGIIPCVD